MDARHFDALTRVLATPDTRRRLLGWLASLPLLGHLLGWLDPEESAAKDRRRRRKGRHKHRQGKAKAKGKRQRRKRACKPKGKAKVCAGQCGTVQSRQTCGKPVDCGSCACDPMCATCFICQAGPNTPGTCVPDPEQVGEPCGSPGQVCASDGSCVCVSNGNAPCSGGETCCAAGCFDLDTDAANCGTCGHACATDQTCEDGVCGVSCGSDFCPAASEICVDDACVACDVTCPAADHTCAGAELQTTIEGGGTVHVCPGRYTGNFSVAASASVTVIGAGMGEDPAADTILDAQQSGSPVDLGFDATGNFRRVRITGGVRCGGAGVYAGSASTLTMTACVVTGNDAGDCSGGGLYASGSVTLTDCLVSKNTADDGGGMYLNGNAAYTLNGTVVRENTGTSNAGIAVNTGSLNVSNASLITENTATSGSGGIRSVNGTTVTISDDSLVVDNEPVDCVITGALNGVCGPKP